MTEAPPGGVPAPPPATIRWHVWLYTPPEQRVFAAALFAIEQEIAASTRHGLDHGVAHARLGWWQDECGRIAAGRAAHPFGRVLERERTVAASGSAARPRPALLGLVENARWDLAGATFDTRPELEAYCRRWAEGVTLSLAQAATPADVAVFALATGAAVREIELLATLAPDARLGRLRLPLDELERLGVAPEALAHPPWPPPLVSLLRERYRELQRILATAAGALVPAQRPAVRALAVWKTLAARRAACAAQALPAPATERRSDRLVDTLSAWRAARRALAHRF